MNFLEECMEEISEIEPNSIFLDEISDDSSYSEGFGDISIIHNSYDVTPIVLSLDMPQREPVIDTEDDYVCQGMDDFFADFKSFLGPDIVFQLESKNWKDRARALNDIQLMFEHEENMNDYAEILLDGLRKLPGTSEKNISVSQVFVDLIRNIIVKSDRIRKAAITPYFPFFIEKIPQKKLFKPCCDLIMIITKCFCPSYTLYNLITCVSSLKNPKYISSILGLSIDILSEYGPSNLNIEKYIPHLQSYISHQNASLRTCAIFICSHLYIAYGNTIFKYLSDLSSSTKQKIISESTKINEISITFQEYYRKPRTSPKTKSPRKSEPQTESIMGIIGRSVSINNDDISFYDQKQIIQIVSQVISQNRSFGISDELGQLIKLLSTIANQGNKNIIEQILCLLEELALSCKDNVSSYSSLIVSVIISGWSDQRQAIREQTTRTACSFRSPSLFLSKALSQNKFSSDMKKEFLCWIELELEYFSNSDLELMSTFLFDSIDDKIPEVRKNSISISKLIYNRIPKYIESIISTFNEGKVMRIKEILNMPTESKRDRKNKSPQKAFAEDFTSTENEKEMRLLSIEHNFGLSIITDIEKRAHMDIYVQTNMKKCFSKGILTKFFNSFDDNVCNYIIKRATDNDKQVYNCSDLISFFIILKMISGHFQCSSCYLNVIMSIYGKNNNVSNKEVDIILPTVFHLMEKNENYVDEFSDVISHLRQHCSHQFFFEKIISYGQQSTINGIIEILHHLQFFVSNTPKPDLIIEFAYKYCDHENLNIMTSARSLLALTVSFHPCSLLYKYIKPINDSKYDMLSTFLPNMPQITQFPLKGFSESLMKVSLLKQLQDAIFRNDLNTCFFVHDIENEFLLDNVDWVLMKHLLFAVFHIISRCKTDTNELMRLFSVLIFFGNRYQKQILLINGVWQLLDSNIRKLFELLPYIDLFTEIQKRIELFNQEVTYDSFFCKVWVSLMKRIDNQSEKNVKQRQDLFKFALNNLKDNSDGSVLSKLIEALYHWTKESPKTPENHPRSILLDSNPTRLLSPSPKPINKQLMNSSPLKTESPIINTSSNITNSPVKHIEEFDSPKSNSASQKEKKLNILALDQNPKSIGERDEIKTPKKDNHQIRFASPSHDLEISDSIEDIADQNVDLKDIYQRMKFLKDRWFS